MDVESRSDPSIAVVPAGASRRPWVALALALGAVALLTLSACDDTPSEGCFCTLEFRTYTLTVLRSSGELAVDATVEVTSLRTGRTFEALDTGLGAPGVLVIMDDSYREEVFPPGERFEIDAEELGASVTTEFLFGTDDCRCHVQKLAGPDTVTLVFP